MMTASRRGSIPLMTVVGFMMVGLWGASAAADVHVASKTSEKPWNVSVGVSNVVGSGTFVTNPYIRQSSDWVGQSWSVGAGYGFDVFGRELVLRSSWSFDYEFTTPNGAIPRRVSPHDFRISLSESESYRDELTGVVLSSGLQLTLPVSHESRGATDLYFALGLSGDLSRSFGPVSLSWSLGMTKYVQGSTIKRSYGIERCGAGQGRGPTDAVSFSPDACSAVQGLHPEGFPNTSMLLNNQLAVSWQVAAHITASYSVGLNQYFKYGMPSDDSLTSVHARGGVRRVDYFWPTLDLSVGLSDLVDELGELPVELSLSTGISAAHPTRSADDQSIIWPFFAGSFGSGRAADGYGSVYLDLNGTW